MKRLLLLTLAVSGLTGCIQEPPVEHVYHTRTVYVPEHRYEKAPAAAAPESPEGFRAVERPGTYSQ